MLSDYTLNKETPVPLYFQLKTLILDRIKDGTYRPGDLIPTENELSSMFNISRTTVRQAVTELVRDGYLYRIKSKGTFVSKPKINQRVLSRYFSHDDAIRGAGRNMKMEILKKEVIVAPQFLVDMGVCQSGERSSICIAGALWTESLWPAPFPICPMKSSQITWIWSWRCIPFGN